jgi:hypothetical protein
MRKRTTVILAAAVASLALLVPAGSAQGATLHTAPFCGSLHPGGGYDPVVLKPGQACTFWPVAVNEAAAIWGIIHDAPGGPGVCLGVVAYPPGWPRTTTALSPVNGQPGKYWTCKPANQGISGGSVVWRAQNSFGAVYGQAVLLNFSNATINTIPSWGWINYFA